MLEDVAKAGFPDGPIEITAEYEGAEDIAKANTVADKVFFISFPKN